MFHNVYITQAAYKPILPLSWEAMQPHVRVLRTVVLTFIAMYDDRRSVICVPAVYGSGIAMRQVPDGDSSDAGPLRRPISSKSTDWGPLCLMPREINLSGPGSVCFSDLKIL